MRNGKYAARRSSGTKVFSLMLAVLLLVGCSVGATLAWLTATTNAVTNTFTVGKVNITLQEHEYTESTNSLGTKTVPGNTYKLIPGKNMPKDPYVTVTDGSEKCWVFVCIKETNNSLGTGFADDVIGYSIKDGWQALISETLIDDCDVYYRVVDTTDMGKALYVLDANGCDDASHANGCVTVNADVTSSFESTPKLEFTAAAIQHDGVADAETAFANLPDAFRNLCVKPVTEPET